MTVLSNSDLETIARGRHPEPFSVLGPHLAPDGGTVVRVFRPGAIDVSVEQDGREYPCRWIHGDGVLEATLPGAPAPYRLRIRDDAGTATHEDPYRFASTLVPDDLAAFRAGTEHRAWMHLGAHVCEHESVAGTRFAVWAPNAERVSVVGSFNDWDGRVHGMRRLADTGVWEIFLPAVLAGALYKYEVRTQHGGRKSVKADPFARAMELRPDTASVVAQGEGAFAWSDATWVAERTARQGAGSPVSIYEVHAGSWRRPADVARPGVSTGADSLFLDWNEFADRLIPYVSELGFTHIELLPVTEHPFDGSWGYQTIGYFAPTSRFGPPDGLRRFVDQAHAAGIGVLLDWVPAHFPTDAHGPAYFDGTHLFEPADVHRRVHPDWNTFIFDYDRPEVRSFLLSSAAYWLEQYHIDGLRVDAVASMLYLDYSRGPGEWTPNVDGGRENLGAVDFLRELNRVVRAIDPGLLTIAEESTHWPGVTRGADDDGLGFDLKWNMGWMNDTLRFFATDPARRVASLEELTFGLTYAFEEHHLLPLSHDEVVHLKKSLLSKMPGDASERLANLRTLYGLMWAHPGRKLLFMGGEIGQEAEWDHDSELDWSALEDPAHRGLRDFVTTLNRVYRDNPALHAEDDTWDGFAWVELGGPDRCGLAFLRRPGGEVDLPVLVVANLSDQEWPAWRVGVPVDGVWRRLLNSEEVRFGGKEDGPAALPAEAVPSHDHDWSLVLDVPALSISYWQAPRALGVEPSESGAAAAASPVPDQADA